MSRRNRTKPASQPPAESSDQAEAEAVRDQGVASEPEMVVEDSRLQGELDRVKTATSVAIDPFIPEPRKARPAPAKPPETPDYRAEKPSVEDALRADVLEVRAANKKASNVVAFRRLLPTGKPCRVRVFGLQDPNASIRAAHADPGVSMRAVEMNDDDRALKAKYEKPSKARP